MSTPNWDLTPLPPVPGTCTDCGQVDGRHTQDCYTDFLAETDADVHGVEGFEGPGNPFA